MNTTPTPTPTSRFTILSRVTEWTPMTEADRMGFAGTAEEAYIAEVDGQAIVIMSVEEDGARIEIIHAETGDVMDQFIIKTL